MDKGPDAFRTISEAADDLDLPQHVLRFWETRFSQIKPMKRGGGRRYYRPDDIDLLRGIRHLLYGEGYTIKGVQRILREQGTAYVTEAGRTKSLPVAGRDDQTAEATTVADEAAGAQAAPAAQPQVAAPAPVAAAQAPAGLSDADRQALGGIIKELEAVRNMLIANRQV